MDSVRAYVDAPSRTTGFIVCLLCKKVQGWIFSPIGERLRAKDFKPSVDNPGPLPRRGRDIVCAWCGAPCIPVPMEQSYDELVGWKILVKSA